MSERLTGADFDKQIVEWRKLRDKTPPGTAKHQRVLDKIELLERFRREEFGPRKREAQDDGKWHRVEIRGNRWYPEESGVWVDDVPLTDWMRGGTGWQR